jgi:hypothetical protein
MIAFSDFAVLFPLLTFVLLSALQRVIKKYNASPHPISPSNKQRKAYGSIKMQMTTSLFDLVRMTDPADVITSANPISMESVGQMFGFLLYESSYIAKKSGNTLRIPKVHDRAQVFVSCLSQDVDVGVLRYIGTTERWNNQPISLPTIECTTNTSLFILVRESLDPQIRFFTSLWSSRIISYIKFWLSKFLLGSLPCSCFL